MSKKSNKPEVLGNPSSIANAMYDAQKKEINSSMALSGSFIAAGLIVAVLGGYKYYSVKSAMTDSSESIDAMAWIVIAGVGLLVGIIGLVSIMKSIVSLKQIGSWAEEAESHASPFQGQKLNRKVAAMNQSQSMQNPEMGSAPPAKARFGIFKRGKDTKNKQNNDELYYKYNPQEKPKASKPEKSAPVMEQKFDYGINEAKKLTFADEFLKKNKRDPFAQYRKDLGMEEEVQQEAVQKPRFITHGVANNSAPPMMPNQQLRPKPSEDHSQMSLMEEFNLGTADANELQLSSSFDENDSSSNFSLSSDFDNNDDNDNNLLDFEEEQENSQMDTMTDNESVPMSFENDSVSNSPYGMRNSEDDDIFFSAKTVTPPPVPVAQQGVKPNLAAALDNAAPKAPAPSTVMLNLDYKEKRATDEYNFSLFEEIDPVKANKAKNQQKKSVQPAQQQAKPLQQKPVQQNDQQMKSYDFGDMFYGESSTSSQKQDPPSTQKAFMSNFVSSVENQEDLVLKTQRSPSKPQMQYPGNERPEKQSVQQQNAQSNNQQKKPTTTPHQTRNTRYSKKKKSFSENYLNKNGKNAEGNSDIIKNGTRSQRKFVDASEYDEWSCPECGKVNQEYVGICACGARKPRAKKH